MSERFMMPQNKREDLIFTILCVLFMCMCMLIYNMFLIMGVTWEAIQQAWALMPLTFAVCFCVDYFIACPVSKKNWSSGNEALAFCSTFSVFYGMPNCRAGILLWRVSTRRLYQCRMVELAPSYPTQLRHGPAADASGLQPADAFCVPASVPGW